MKKLHLLFMVMCYLLAINPLFAQINSGDPAIPFGSNTSYNYGILPSNLPTGGTYGNSQAAADAYTYWRSNFTKSCTDKGYRVLYDDYSSTVSEGIAYGMLLSAYAGDKDLFDGLWEFYTESVDTNGLMNWKYSDCSTLSGSGAATDADLDAAMALIIASKQWPDYTSPYVYEDEAISLISAIRKFEIDSSSYQTLNGDGWGTTTCRNPSYFSTAYYREFAKLETSYADFWTNVADEAEYFLLTNRNSTTGLVCNWADDEATSNDCNGTSSLGITNEFGFDACRNPWRMATDVLWNGSSTAVTAYDICEKIAGWLDGYESNLKGPLAQTASNPSAGLYKNGSFSTYALATMVDSSFLTSLNSCYTNVAALGNESYFNQSIKTLTLFMLTGNFWAPDTISTEPTAPEFYSATTNPSGSTITVTFNKPINTPSSSDKTAFTLKINGSSVSGAFSAIGSSGSRTLYLSVSDDVTIESTDVLTISYTPGTIESSASIALEAFSNESVTNSVGTSTLVADAETGSQTYLLTEWYSFDDDSDGGSSSVTPLTDDSNLFTMTAGGAMGTDSAAKISYTLSVGSLSYDPYVGFGFTLNEDESAYDLDGSDGITFYHKGDAATLMVGLSTNTNYNYYGTSVSKHSTWTEVTVSWDDLAQADWGESTGAVTWDASKITRIYWQVQESDGTSGEVWIDEVQIDGITLDLPTVVEEVDNTILSETLETANGIADTAQTGTTAGTYPEEALTDLESAISDAQTVYDDALSTQTEIDQAVTDLEDAIEAFKNGVNTGESIDVSALTAIISYADSILTNVVIGDSVGNYPQTAADILQAAIDSAEVIEDSPETQYEVNKAVSTLQDAIDTFLASLIADDSIDLSELIDLISKADSIISAAVVGEEDGQYSQATVDAFNLAIEVAEAIKDSPESQSVVDQAIEDLTDAINAFLANVILTSGVNENSIAMKLYPNPVDDKLTVEVSGLQQVRIASMSGQVLVVTSESVVDVSGLAGGIYIASVVTESGTTTEMIIVE